ncbi:MAG TPA: hypothetical protein VKU38_04490 [Ktedonobacteraceae bacterium]|nr:hypothetical protein [Ktedonobacteraceae bacterium]
MICLLWSVLALDVDIQEPSGFYTFLLMKTLQYLVPPPGYQILQSFHEQKSGKAYDEIIP